ncbi:class I SAM-dependent methyltransferase [Flavobacterium sp. 103]|uniref:class I SAM-dependent methyltransferase n=1 Tax=Flavobacterium sp. 103 TaxID=2135624 RepID=UPI001403230F|nr:class I SAM-dependent methyltransferase [Flavobacterium sp. 103]
MIFCLTAYSQEQFVTVYDELYNKENSKYQRHSKIEFDQIVQEQVINIGLNRSRLIKKNILNTNCQSVLEIGSGIGLIGAHIRLKNEQILYTGIELDEEAFRKSQQLKLNTINGDFKEMEKIKGQFDVIMLWEVIEHLQDLKLFLDLAYKKLNYNGKIILSTPNYNKILNYPDREKDQLFQDEPPIHLNFFTAENIKNIFEFHHFVNCKIMVKKFPYVELNKKRFYLNSFKALLNSYQGSTIYLEAIKK